MTSRLERAWVHTVALYDCASPVVVLKRGKKFASVRLKHGRRWNRKTEVAGTVVRVPLFALCAEPRVGALVSVGRMRFEPGASPRAREMVKAWRAGVKP